MSAFNRRRAAELAPAVGQALSEVSASGRDAAPVAEIAVMAAARPMDVGLVLKFNPALGWRIERREGRAWAVRGSPDFPRPRGVSDRPAPAPAPATAADVKREHGPGFLDWLFGP